LRLASHQVADMIFEKILGIRGAFATRIAYISVLGHLPVRTYRLIVADADGENPACRDAIERAADVARLVARRPEPGLRVLRGSAAVGLRAILKTGERRRVSARAGVNQAPAWSPDGKKLALTLSTRDGNLDVYVLDLATQALTRITDDPGIDTEPQWSKDGQSLYFTSDRAGGPQIYKIGLSPATSRAA
jgi:TolB protein